MKRSFLHHHHRWWWRRRLQWWGKNCTAQWFTKRPTRKNCILQYLFIVHRPSPMLCCLKCRSLSRICVLKKRCISIHCQFNRQSTSTQTLFLSLSLTWMHSKFLFIWKAEICSKCPATQTSWIFDIFFCDFVVWSWFNIKQTNERSWSERERKKRRTVLMFNSVVSDSFHLFWYQFFLAFFLEHRTEPKKITSATYQTISSLAWLVHFIVVFLQQLQIFDLFFSLVRTMHTHTYWYYYIYAFV